MLLIAGIDIIAIVIVAFMILAVVIHDHEFPGLMFGWWLILVIGCLLALAI